MLLTTYTNTIVFLGLGFVLGFLLNGLFYYQDQLTMEKFCTDKQPIYQLYKNCMKRQRDKCRGKTELTAVSPAPALKSIKIPQRRPRGATAAAVTRKRYQLLSQELATRKLLLVGVVTAQKFLETRATAVYNTWGKQMGDVIFFSEQPNSTQHIDFPVVTLEGVDDNIYPPQLKVFKMLQYMYKYIDQFDFFMRIDDDAYVKKQQLYDLLLATNPAQDIYMGSPGFGKPEDRKRLHLEEHEHYCMGGPGMIFSKALFRKLGPEVDDCLDNVVFSDYDEDVEVGRCISHKIHVQCTWSYQTREVFFTDYSKGLETERLYEMDSVKSAITFHPLKNPIHMYRVHQYIVELSAAQLHEDAVKNTYEIQKINEMIPVKLQRYRSETWLGHFTKFQPSSRFKVPVWYYFNSTRLFTDTDGKQALTLPTDLKNSVNTIVLQVLINHLNHFSPKGQQYTPYLLYDGFTVTDLSRGAEYVLHLSVHLNGSSDPHRLVANIFLPFSSSPMIQYKSWSTIAQSTRISMLVHINKQTDYSHFFGLFEKICLKGNLKVSLHVSLTTFDGTDKVIKEISSLRSRYPMGDISYKLTTQTARGLALHQVVPQNKEQLLLFFDPNYILTETFIDHCLMNTIVNKQVYFPVSFSLYNSNTAGKLNVLRIRKSVISEETGFWNKRDYRIVCIYQSDYENIGGFDTSMHTREDVALFEKIRRSPLRIFRALEPYLIQPFMKRSCQNLPKAEQVMCLNDVIDTVGSRRQLGLLVLKHKIL